MDLLERLLSKTKRNGACLLWTGSVNHKGYGQIKITLGVNAIDRVHRVMYELVHGPIPNGECVAHTCDVRNCIEPDHLALATFAENTADMVKKGRDNFGHSPLTVDDVRFIRSSIQTSFELACKYNVNEKTIRNVRNRKTWSHIE